MAVTSTVRRGRGRPRSNTSSSPAASVQSLDRALTLLGQVAVSDGLSLTELSQRAGFAPSTAHRLLMTLQSHGMVDFLDDLQHWVIGVEAYRIGSAFLRRTNVVEIGRAVMHDLMEASGETVNLAIADDGDVVFISQVETHEAIRAFFRPGSRGPMHASGIGKALLAELPDRKVRQILQKQGLAGFTAKTIVDSAQLLAELHTTRHRGWALDDEERNLGMRCVAASIYNEHGEAVAGISVSGPTVRIPDQRIGELGPQVKRAADRITASIGGCLPARSGPA